MSQLLVVVAPHPDDEVIGFGGVLFDHVRSGGQALILSLTDGEAFDPHASWASRRDAAATRRAEQLEALGVLGVEPHALVRMGLPDGGVAGCEDEVRVVLQEMLSASTTVSEPLAVAPSRSDGHPDHEAASRAVRSCIDCEILEVPIWSWRRPRRSAASLGSSLGYPHL